MTRLYSQRFSQLSLSEVYTEHFFSFYNSFFTKSKIILFFKKCFCSLAAYLRKMFANLIKLHNDAYLKQIK